MAAYRNVDAPAEMDESVAAPQPEPAHTGASLVIDLDEYKVRGVLMDSVEGFGRFVASAEAPSTMGPPIGDPGVCVREVIARLEAQTGYRLGGTSDEAGADGPFALTGYPAPPLSVAIVPTGEATLMSALVTTGRATPSIVHVLNGEVRTEDGVLSSTMLESRLRSIRPDIVVLLEGDRVQSEWASAVGTLGMLLKEEALNQIVVLAAEEFQQYLIQTLGDNGNLTGLDPGSYEMQDVAVALETELSELYSERVAAGNHFELGRDPAFVSRLRSSDLATRYISRRLERSVASVDVSAGAVVNWSTLDSAGSLARPDLDTHANIRSLLGPGFEALRALVPFEISQEELANWILNRAVRPRAVSDLGRDQIVESVILSQIVAIAWGGLAEVASDQLDIVVAGPAFCTDTDPVLGVLAAINGFQPAPLNGLVQVMLDPDGLLSAAGAIGAFAPSVAADVVDHDALDLAATIVVIEGAGAETQPVVRGTLSYEEGEAVKFTVPFGSLYRLPLSEDEAATLTLTCEPGFSVGGSSPGEQVEFGPEDGLAGGLVGIIIDARGQPIAGREDTEFPDRESVSRWYSDLGIEIQ